MERTRPQCARVVSRARVGRVRACVGCESSRCRGAAGRRTDRARARTERTHALASLVLKRRVERAAYDDDDDEVETRAGRCRR